MEKYLDAFRYTISLVFGITATAAFADIREQKNAGRWMLAVTCLLLLIQGLFLRTVGVDKIFLYYPLHTHLVLALSMILYYRYSVHEAMIDTLLAYMCCQIPAWISKLADYLDFGGRWAEVLIYFLVAVIMGFCIVKYMGKPIHELVTTSPKTALAFAIVPVTYYFFDYYATVWTKRLYTGDYHITQFMPFVVCIGYLVFAIVYSHEQMARIAAMEEKNILENELYIVENEMENLSQLEQMSRIYRHDMRHHMSLIGHMIEQHHEKEALDYIHENLEAIDHFTPRRYCEVEMLNLLLSHFASRAENANVEYHFDIRIPEKLPLSNTEICTLLSNALENALNAVEELAETRRYVDVRFCEFNQKLVLSIDNSCDEKVRVIPNFPESNREGHGYGMKSIMSIAHAHQGMATFQVVDGMFHLMVNIPI